MRSKAEKVAKKVKGVTSVNQSASCQPGLNPSNSFPV